MTGEQISRGQLRTFLQCAGWNQLPDRSPVGESWVLGDDETAPAILVPDDPADRDYVSLMRSASSAYCGSLGCLNLSLSLESPISVRMYLR